MQKRVDVGTVLSRVFSIYGSQASTLLPVAFALFLVVGIAQGLVGPIGGILGLIAGTFYTGMVVRLVEDVQDGRRDHSAGDLLSSVAPVALPLIGASLIVGIVTFIGFLLFIAPGLFLLTIWAVVAPVIVLERVGVFASLGRSRALVKGDGWPVLGTVLVATVISIIASVLALIVTASAGSAAGIVVGAILSAITAPISALLASVLYFTLRGSSGPGDTSGGVVTAGPEAPGATPPPPPPPAGETVPGASTMPPPPPPPPSGGPQSPAR